MNLAFPSLVDAKVLHQPPIAPGWRTPPLKEPALLPWVEWGQSTILPLPTIIELLSRALSYYEKNQHLPSVFLLPFLFAKLNSIIPGFLGHLEFTPAVWKIVNHFAAHRSSHRTNLSSNSCKYDFIPKIKGRREHVKSSRMNKITDKLSVTMTDCHLTNEPLRRRKNQNSQEGTAELSKCLFTTTKRWQVRRLAVARLLDWRKASYHDDIGYNKKNHHHHHRY